MASRKNNEMAGREPKRELAALVASGRLPGPFHCLLGQYLGDTQPFRKAHRLVDALEWAIKWQTVLVVSDLLREADVPAGLRKLFSEGLRTPSLGAWVRFCLEATAAIRVPSAPWNKWDVLTPSGKGLEDRFQLVTFRNSYAHGATPVDTECLADIAKYEPALAKLAGSPFLTEAGLVVAGADGTCVLRGAEREPLPALELPPGEVAALLPGSKTLNLWPLTVCADPGKSSRWEFFFFNALKDDKVEHLNYELPARMREKTLWEPFHQRIPLREWRTSAGGDEFLGRAEAMSDSFKGRRDELCRLLSFCTNGRGRLMVWGAPGMGKSALLARTLCCLRAGIDADGGRLNSVPPVLHCFLRRQTDSARRQDFLRRLGEWLETHYKDADAIPSCAKLAGDELADNVRQRLAAIDRLPHPKRMVLFVDGLDEADADLLLAIPEARPWLCLLVSGRPTKPVQAFHGGRDRECREEMEIGPLAGADIRAMLYDVTNKYNPQLTPAYIEGLVARSGGSPLYMTLQVASSPGAAPPAWRRPGAAAACRLTSRVPPGCPAARSEASGACTPRGYSRPTNIDIGSGILTVY